VQELNLHGSVLEMQLIFTSSRTDGTKINTLDTHALRIAFKTFCPCTNTLSTSLNITEAALKGIFWNIVQLCCHNWLSGITVRVMKAFQYLCGLAKSCRINPFPDSHNLGCQLIFKHKFLVQSTFTTAINTLTLLLFMPFKHKLH
jgi:hypothetical protein